MAELTTGKVIALIKALSTSSATYTVTDALVIGAATTSGVRLDLETGTLAVREGDDSAYAPLRCGQINFSQFSAGLTTGGNNLNFAAGSCFGWTSVTSAKTTDYTVTGAESSAVFSNEGAAGAVNLTLPGAVAGYHYSVAVQANQYLRFTAAAGDTIRDGGTVSAAAGYIRSTTVGSTLYLRAINTTEWVVFSKTGTWTIDS